MLRGFYGCVTSQGTPIHYDGSFSFKLIIYFSQTNAEESADIHLVQMLALSASVVSWMSFLLIYCASGEILIHHVSFFNRLHNDSG